MELALRQKGTTAAMHRKRLQLREINRRLKTEYHADMAAPFSRSLCELLEKLETMSAEDGNRVPS